MEPPRPIADTQSNSMPSLPPVVPLPAAPAGTPTNQNPAAVPLQPAAADNTPAVADDNDLIEKPWIQKIEQVTGATREDPYEQNRQFSALKADYMQKRYGKVIKSDE